MPSYRSEYGGNACDAVKITRKRLTNALSSNGSSGARFELPKSGELQVPADPSAVWGDGDIVASEQSTFTNYGTLQMADPETFSAQVVYQNITAELQNASKRRLQMEQHLRELRGEGA